MHLITSLTKSRSSIALQSIKSISTFVHVGRESAAAAAEPPLSPLPPSLPQFETPTPPRYNPITNTTSSLLPIGRWFLDSTHNERVKALTRNLDAHSLTNKFSDWGKTDSWPDIKQSFEFWVKSLDKSGKPNRPDVGLYNHYLRANFMIGATAGELLSLVLGMEELEVLPNTATYNLVLKAMQGAGETMAAEKLIERMLQTGKEHKEFLPNEESYDLVINMLLSTNQIDSSLKYIDMSLKSGYTLSTNAFAICVRSCVKTARLDALVSIIERCKKMDQNKSLCPPWSLCNYIADVALQSDHDELIFYAVEFMAKWIARGEIADPPIHLSVDEGLVASALSASGRTYSSKLLDGSWAVLKRSLREKKNPNPESYLAKIDAHSNLGNLQKAFSTLFEFETALISSDQECDKDLFSPFTSLNPLVVACSKKGAVSLDSVYYQLENLSKANQPIKSLAALNCVILGCANTWDVECAYRTFSSIDAIFGLSPDIHSYNALICAFGKLGKRDEAVKLYEHFIGSGLAPNRTTYSLLIDSHLVKRDPKAALSIITEMIEAGFEPSKEMLKKVRRRCVREMDYESDDKVESLARQYNVRMGTEVRRDLLFHFNTPEIIHRVR